MKKAPLASFGEGRGRMAMAMVAKLHFNAVYQMLSLSLSSSDSVVQQGVF